MNAPAKIAQILRDGSAELAADNAAAAKVEAERDWKALDALLDKYGYCNVITACGNHARAKEDEAIGGADYAFAAEVLEAASGAVDLPYSVRNIRPMALNNLKAAVAVMRV